MAEARLCDKCGKVYKKGDDTCTVKILFGERCSWAQETQYSGSYYGELCEDCSKWVKDIFDVKVMNDKN